MGMKLFTFYSSCGHKFGRSGSGTETEMKCPKCGAEIAYTVDEQTVIVKIIKPSEKSRWSIFKN